MELNIRKYFTQFILILLIFLNILDFFKFLPEDFDFLKKVISWALVAHLFYDVSFTRLFFGQTHDKKSGFLRNRYLDLLILFSFLLLTMKELVVVAIGLEELTFFHSLIESIKYNAQNIMNVSTYAGAILLIVLSFYLALYTKVSKTSLMGNLGLYNKNVLLKIIATFLVLTTFYAVVFELLLEWLAIAVDSTLIIIGIFTVFYLIFRLHKHISIPKLISKIGTFGEDFEEHFLNFFHDKAHFFLGVSGLLVLHLLTEISNFLIPYFLNLVSSHYFLVLGHESFYNLFIRQFNQNPLVIFGYLFNMVAILGLTIFPAVLWYEVYKNKHKTIPKSLLAIYFGSLVFLILNPLFV
ncbi:hypothetical protein KY321_05475, partial [Candidatus Woesearchaeota archaeon]|nr:hypothetical protein [Candidatus Woesearchaeota archaeon]